MSRGKHDRWPSTRPNIRSGIRSCVNFALRLRARPRQTVCHSKVSGAYLKSVFFIDLASRHSIVYLVHDCVNVKCGHVLVQSDGLDSDLVSWRCIKSSNDPNFLTILLHSKRRYDRTPLCRKQAVYLPVLMSAFAQHFFLFTVIEGKNNMQSQKIIGYYNPPSFQLAQVL